MLSNIVLERTNDKTKKYLSQSQSAYREFRSTSDIVWAYRWLTSRTEIYKETSNISSPQGDGLSGKLFVIYFENVLKEVREVLSGIEKSPTMLPDEAIYADDADFITQDPEKKKSDRKTSKTYY